MKYELLKHFGFVNTSSSNDLTASYSKFNSKLNEIYIRIWLPNSKQYNPDQDKINTYAIELNNDFILSNELIFESKNFNSILSIIKSNETFFHNYITHFKKDK